MKVFGGKDRPLIYSISCIVLSSFFLIISFSTILGLTVALPTLLDFHEENKVLKIKQVIFILDGVSPMFLMMTFTFDLFRWIIFIISAASDKKESKNISKNNKTINIALYIS